MKNLTTLIIVRTILITIIAAFGAVAYFIAYNAEGYIMCALPIIALSSIAIIIKKEKVPTRLKKISDRPNKIEMKPEDHMILN